MKTTLRYLFPWVRPVASRESFTLLDGAISGFVQHVSSEAGTPQYAAMLGAYDLGTFADLDSAKNAVENAATDKINAMLAVILPNEVKQWLVGPP